MDHAALVDALDHVWSSTSEVLHDAGGDVWGRPTGCPGWTVQDQLSHMVWSADIWRGVAPEAVELPDFAHVRGPVAEYMELAVHARRERAGVDVLAEFDASAAAAVDDLRRRLPDGLDEPIAGPMGYEMPRTALLGVSLFDQWVHGFDIRLALDVEPDRASTAAHHSVAQTMAGWAAKAGEMAAVDVAVVLASADLYGEGQAATAGASAGPSSRPARIGAGDPVSVVELGFDDFVTRAAGRDRPVGPVEITGDELAARDVLDLLPVTP